MTDIVLLSGARAPIGSFGGSLAGFAPSDLATHVAKAAIARSGLAAERIGQVVFGHIINTEPRDMYVSRVAAVQAGVPVETPAMNVNRLCGSGAQAVVSAAQALMLNEADFALAGGVDVMSRAPHILQTARFGQKMGDTTAIDMMTGALSCPFGTGHMGVTAENVAAQYGITRAAQDAFALESQRRAVAAIAAGAFAAEIAPVEITSRKGTVVFDTDEYPKETTLEKLAALKPAFRKEGTVTAGNASGLNDGAAALVLARASAAKAAGLRPLARIAGFAVAGVAPEVMGLGPIPAVRRLCEKTGLRVQDFDVIESNEAFAAQALAVSQELGFDPEKVNPDGGAIALGHPIGATGAILTVKAMHRLHRTGGRYALVTMCIGGGQGIALALERL